MARREKPVFLNDPQWYKDAVIYQVHVKSFYDANNDGIGDFAGLIEKLDYIADLGVNTLWLLPFYPSPRRDDGYDIAQYRGVHSDYGSLADARRFIAEAHRRGLRVITELVIDRLQRRRRAPRRRPRRQGRTLPARRGVPGGLHPRPGKPRPLRLPRRVLPAGGRRQRLPADRSRACAAPVRWA